MLDYLILALGLVILLLAGDALVKGAVNLSLRVGIPAFIVSLTIVAFGTSAPELLVSVNAALDEAPGIALGNVVGSNIANVLLVLGLPALISGLHTSECDTRESYAYMLVGSILFILLCFLGPLIWVHGLVLLSALALVLYKAAVTARAHRRGMAAGAAAALEAEEEEEVEGANPDMSRLRIGIYIALGLIGLPLGADLLVDSAVDIARDVGVSERVIGLTLVAFGTSLPELATTLVAGVRRQADVALGNVIGSNMFNLLAIIGVTTLIAPLPIPPAMLRFDLWVMLAASLLLIPFVFMRKDIGRVAGVILTGLYVLYVVALID